MKSFAILAIACTASLACAGSFDEIVRAVNGKANNTWVAQAPSRFGTLDDVKELCGTFRVGTANFSQEHLPLLEELDGFEAVEARADGLDWRTKAPQCTVISKIRDQSACGSCWAFGSTETFEDRRCISTGKDVELSSMDTAGCCSGFACGLSMGCGGGQPGAALRWMTKTGVVTGGDYQDVGSGSSCKPYTFEACAHHVPPSSKYPACPSKEYTAHCTKSCSESKYTTSYADDKVKGGSASSVGTVSGMITALEKGPLSVAFDVYSDFPTYKSGVYKHTTGSMLGGHAVEIIGYGTENGSDYWLVKNSWNEQWGDGGTFKIARGNNECGIESQVSVVDF
jgi:cathepsin B